MKMSRMYWLACLAGCAPGIATEAGPGEPPVPPTVLAGHATLRCNISANATGVQKLTVDKGSGLSFDAVVSPIVDGEVELKGPEQGGAYGFTSHLARPATGNLTGVGPVTLESLDTKVRVTVKRYQQPGGPGKAFSFGDRDLLDGQGAYIEFVGKARSARGERFGFRVTLSDAVAGSGEVEPAGPNYNDHIMAKTVIVTAPVTTVTTSTNVTRLR